MFLFYNCTKCQHYNSEFKIKKNAELERILNFNVDQLKILATSKGITFASGITKPELQVLVLSEVNKSSEQSVIQAKLQLVEAENKRLRQKN